jgi:hypothetical protein
MGAAVMAMGRPWPYLGGIEDIDRMRAEPRIQ